MARHGVRASVRSRDTVCVRSQLLLFLRTPRHCLSPAQARLSESRERKGETCVHAACPALRANASAEWPAQSHAGFSPRKSREQSQKSTGKVMRKVAQRTRKVTRRGPPARRSHPPCCLPPHPLLPYASATRCPVLPQRMLLLSIPRKVTRGLHAESHVESRRVTGGKP
eukprot:110789-Rhodomonas_salina.1